MSAHSIFQRKLVSKNSLYYFVCAVCVVLVGTNIFASQTFNSHMYGVMEGEESPTLSYLKHLWGSPLFALEMDTYKNEQKQEIVEGWMKIQKENAERIKHLENASRLYPYSPEIYYNLHLLYSENGEKGKAADNLQKAQHIDPSIQ